MSAVDYFLALTGVEGECQDDAHRGEIQIDSWSWGASNAGTMQYGGGGGGGRATMRDFFFTMSFNRASPKLIQKLASGEHIPKAVLTCRKAGKTPQQYLKIILHQVIVSSYYVSTARGNTPTPTESVGLNFASVSFEYRVQKADGTLGGAVVATHSVKENWTA